MKFQRATKEQSKLRLALFGPSGSGKTFSALRIATGLGGRVAVIDTERGSASKYADDFSFDVLELDQFGTRVYVEAINAAQRAGYDVLIIDSLTHGWHDLLQEVEKIARAKFSGNTWSAWSEGTPKQREMVNAILSFNGHVIATMRTKTEWALQKNDKDKLVPVRVGMAPEQGKGIEYEFDMLLEINQEHHATVSKDRTGKFQDAVFVPDEDFGRELSTWLSGGAPHGLKSWAQLKERAIAELGFSHVKHVENTLRIVSGGEPATLTLESAWQLLIEHQESRVTEQELGEQLLAEAIVNQDMPV